MRLIYTGPDPAVVGIVPLPEGWPAADHDEEDAEVAKAKVASGNYSRAPKALREPQDERAADAGAAAPGRVSNPPLPNERDEKGE